MKAAQFTKYGEIVNSVIISEIDKPTIKKDEVLIETFAAGVNPLDNKVIEGALKQVKRFKFPATLGYDVSGIVVEKGEYVSQFNIGDEVYSNVVKQGTFAEYVAVSQKFISLKPKNISFEAAASLPLVGLTTIQAMERAELKSGDKILIHAGSGGVGSFAIQYAKAKGAYVYTTTSTTNVKWLKELGADVVIDYKTENYKAIVKDIDIVFDTLGNQYTEDAFWVIKNGGKVISLVGEIDKETAKRMKFNALIQLFLAWKRRKITKLMKQKSASYSLVFMRANGKQLNEIKDLVTEGKIKPQLDKVFNLKETKEALLYVKKGRTRGKVVIKVKQ